MTKRTHAVDAGVDDLFDDGEPEEIIEEAPENILLVEEEAEPEVVTEEPIDEELKP